MSRPPTPTAASLRQDIKDWWDGRSVAAISRSMFDSFIDRAEREAAATERRLTVERVRERLADNHNTLGAEYYRLDQIEDLLDDLLAPTADVDEDAGE